MWPKRENAASLRSKGLFSDDSFTSSALLATERWLNDWVIGLRLCPWAAGSQHPPQMRLLEVEEGEAALERHVALVCEEAQLLNQRAEEEEGFATTLLVFTDKDYQGLPPSPSSQASCGAFPRLWNACNVALQSQGGGSVDLLAFHKHRVDVGPGCRPDPADPAHYSVRSPHPTLQLLLQKDLSSARAAWASGQMGGGGKQRRGPGAFGLLEDNKRRLRETGAEELAKRFEELSVREE